ncbi:hypothetical protein ACWEKJ_30600 [Amycolatopsis thermoflava]|uniref:hypothetical protein n=1 Tax=Amycolatopsis sp. NPDC006125 TaxID=3156730 RepID=UPI0033AB3D5B
MTDIADSLDELCPDCHAARTPPTPGLFHKTSTPPLLEGNRKVKREARVSTRRGSGGVAA